MISEQTTIDPSKVAIYIRWSTEDQGEGTTLEVQSETCRAYLVSQGWVVNPDLIYIDDGYSGGNLERPAMGRLRKAVAAGEVDCIVVYKLDRLSRSVVDTVNLVCREWEGKCSIKSAREPIDTTSHAGKMFFYTLVNYAEWERSVIKERTYSGKLRRAQEGRNPGMRPPYGYEVVEGGGFAILPGEAAMVQRIYQLYLSGLGCRMIVQALNKDGYKPRIGDAWTQSTVARILSNPAYIGRMEYGRRRRSGDKRVMKDPLVVTEQSTIPPLIQKEDWETVQAMKTTKPGFGRGEGSGRSNASESLLTGLLRCTRCGHSYAGQVMNGQYSYYRCQGVHTKGSAFCDSGGVRRELVDELVVKTLRSLYGGQEAKERLVRKMVAHFETQLVEARSALQQIEKDLGALDAGEQRIKKLLRDGELTVPEYRELKHDLEQEGLELRASRDKAKTLERQALAGIQGQKRLLDSLQGVDEWERLSHMGKKQLLRQFIKEIRLYRKARESAVDCHIVWRWDSTAGGEPPVIDSHEMVEQERPAPPRNGVRDGATGRFVSTK